MRLIRRLVEWFDFRLQVADTTMDVARHPTPRSTASWAYVFGSAALMVFVLQIVTGIFLALVYVPSAGDAWNSLHVLNDAVAFGWFVRALHGWGSNFMVAIVLIHMTQVFLFGAFKFPRELTWIFGVFLLLMTLGMAFTGQMIRFDQDAYWGLGLGASIASRVPVVGQWTVDLLLGGPIVAGDTLTRFFAAHVFIIPGLLIAFVSVHLLLVLRLGVSEWPMPGRAVNRKTYIEDYERLVRQDGVPFVPYAIWKDMAFSAVVLLLIVICAAMFGPFGPRGAPDPTIPQSSLRPDFPFLWLFAVLSLLPPALETPAILIGPVVVIAFLLVIPFIAGEGERHWSRRPIAVMSVLLIAVALGVLTEYAVRSPWTPEMDAWSSEPIPPKFLQHRTALERQGALVFQSEQCHNCHSLDGRGGNRGPSLDAVAVRLTPDQLVRQVIQGGGNMPSYRRNLTAAETTALTAFLSTLHPEGQAPARDGSQVGR